MEISYKLFYFSLLTLKFPFNKILSRYIKLNQQTKRIQTLIMEMELMCWVDALCTLISGLIITLIIILSILFLPNSTSIFYLLLIYILTSLISWTAVFLLGSFIACKRYYPTFVKKWHTR